MKEEPPILPHNTEEDIFFEQQNEERLKLLFEKVPGLARQPVQKYLTEFSLELLASEEKLKLIIELLESISFTSPFDGLTQEEHILLDNISSTGLEEKIEDDSKIWDFRNVIAQTRAMAIILEKVCKKDSRKILKATLLKAIAQNCVVNDLTPPTEAHFLLADAIRETKEKSEKFLVEAPKVDQPFLAKEASNLTAELTSEGVDLKIAERISDVKRRTILEILQNQPARISELITRLFKDYPDPRVAIDLILAVKDGKLPI